MLGSKIAAAGGVIAAGLALLATGEGARADGFPPFYGYSGYFGGPAVYYTHDRDVQQSTRPIAGDQGFGVVTYTTGGPFWGYRPSHVRLHRASRRVVLRTKG